VPERVALRVATGGGTGRPVSFLITTFLVGEGHSGCVAPPWEISRVARSPQGGTELLDETAANDDDALRINWYSV